MYDHAPGSQEADDRPDPESEQAERELIERASHGDQRAARRTIEAAPGEHDEHDEWGTGYGAARERR